MGSRWICPDIAWTLSGLNRIGKEYQGLCGGTEGQGRVSAWSAGLLSGCSPKRSLENNAEMLSVCVDVLAFVLDHPGEALFGPEP